VNSGQQQRLNPLGIWWLPAMVAPFGRELIAICDNNISIRNKMQEGQRKTFFLPKLANFPCNSVEIVRGNRPVAIYPGSLLEAIPKLKIEGCSIGFVVVDEQSSPESPKKVELSVLEQKRAEVVEKNYAEVTAAQNKLIEFATQFNYPVWFIETYTNIVSRELRPTREDLSKLAPKSACVVPKTDSNAFSSSNLFDELMNAKIDTLVLLGYEVNCCVRLTAVGGDPGPMIKGNPSGKPLQRGATAFGFLVLTCQQVLRGQDMKGEAPVATWRGDHNVRFYANL
jgi:hypothetical protein